MTCTRCECTGFLNMGQLPDEICKLFDSTGDHGVILKWIEDNNDHDVSVCDCCGNGESWYGTPGYHHTDADGKWDSGDTPGCI